MGTPAAFSLDPTREVQPMKHAQQPKNAMPLVAWAAKAHLSYQTALNMVLRGQVIGWQDARRRWWVDPTDGKRVAEERTAAQATPAA